MACHSFAPSSSSGSSLLAAPDSTVGPFHERDTVLITGLVKDNDTPPNPIPGASLVSATLTLYSEQVGNTAPTYPIINARDHFDIKPNINAFGELALTLTQADMALVDTPTVATEYHRALIEWVWNVDKRGSHEIRIVIRDVPKVGTGL